MGKICVERPYIGVNGHIIVVENNQQIVAGVGGIIDALERQASADGGIADYGHNVATGFIVFK